MAYRIISTGGTGPNGTVIRYGCDEVEDVARLPTGQDNVNGPDRLTSPAPGSSAIVDESKELYWLPPSRNWSPLLVFPQ